MLLLDEQLILNLIISVIQIIVWIKIFKTYKINLRVLDKIEELEKQIQDLKK